jgi:hypothetical protein
VEGKDEEEDEEDEDEEDEVTEQDDNEVSDIKLGYAFQYAAVLVIVLSGETGEDDDDEDGEEPEASNLDLFVYEKECRSVTAWLRFRALKVFIMSCSWSKLILDWHTSKLPTEG